MHVQTSDKEVEARVRTLTPTVQKIARYMMVTVPPSVEFDDLVQCGMVGLLDAARRYDNRDGAAFETYATLRIRGAMLDELRECDWLPRSVRRQMRQAEEAIARLQQQKGKSPTEEEIAESLGVSLRDYQLLLHEARNYQIVLYEDLAIEEDDAFLDKHRANEQADPLTILESKSVHEALVKSIDQLPGREKLVVALYYQEELTLREIGEVLGVTESRASQILTQAIARLRVNHVTH